MIKENKKEHKVWLEATKKELMDKYFDISFEERYQRRWMLLEPTKKTWVGNKQVTVAEYVTSLKNDLNILNNRLKLVNDIISEIN